MSQQDVINLLIHEAGLLPTDIDAKILVEKYSGNAKEIITTQTQMFVVYTTINVRNNRRDTFVTVYVWWYREEIT